MTTETRQPNQQRARTTRRPQEEQEDQPEQQYDQQDERDEQEGVFEEQDERDEQEGVFEEQDGDEQEDTRLPASPGRRREFHEIFDPRAAMRVALLRLADDWRAAGAVHQAIHAYTQILTRYPGSGAASAATEQLVEMARDLQRQGRFYTALSIFDKLEQLL